MHIRWHPRVLELIAPHSPEHDAFGDTLLVLNDFYQGTSGIACETTKKNWVRSLERDVEWHMTHNPDLPRFKISSASRAPASIMAKPKRVSRRV